MKTQLSIFTMNKSLLAIAITAALFPLAFSMEANADIKWNSPVLQGTTMQSTKLQGMELQSLKVEGGQLVAVTRVAGE